MVLFWLQIKSSSALFKSQTWMDGPFPLQVYQTQGHIQSKFEKSHFAQHCWTIQQLCLAFGFGSFNWKLKGLVPFLIVRSNLRVNLDIVIIFSNVERSSKRSSKFKVCCSFISFAVVVPNVQRRCHRTA